MKAGCYLLAARFIMYTKESKIPRGATKTVPGLNNKKAMVLS
jgi:hypothetical protein